MNYEKYCEVCEEITEHRYLHTKASDCSECYENDKPIEYGELCNMRVCCECGTEDEN